MARTARYGGILLLAIVALTLSTSGRPRATQITPLPLNPALDQVIDRYLAEFHGLGGARSPSDGSERAYARQLDVQRQLLKDLQTIDRKTLSFDQDIDYRYLEGLIKTRIFDDERVKRWQQDPRVYLAIEPIIGTHGGLLEDETSPVEQRTKKMLEVMQGIPVRLENGRKNLREYIPLWAEPSKAVLDGDLEIVENAVPQYAQRAGGQRDALIAANGRVIAALKAFRVFLENEWPRRPIGDWRIGKEVFNYRLRNEHMIDDIDVEEFYRWGRRQYEAQLRVLERTAARADARRSWQQIELDLQADHPTAEAMIYEHTKAVRRARPWVVEQDLVTMPWDLDNAAIASAAPAVYGRQQWYGFGGAPVGIGVALPGGWSLVPVDPRWSPERQEEFLRGHNYAMINGMVTHEVYPGHGLMQLYLNHNPRKLRIYESSYSNQAFAYYDEWVLAPEHGFYPRDKQKEYLVEMERNKLWRYARVIYDAGMHTGQVDFDEGVNIMRSGVLFAERFAFIEVEQTTRGGSGTSVPTWGYHQILKLRDEYFGRMAAIGRRATLKDFHDRFLKIGMLPVPLVRETMLHQIEQEGLPRTTSSQQ